MVHPSGVPFSDKPYRVTAYCSSRSMDDTASILLAPAMIRLNVAIRGSPQTVYPYTLGYTVVIRDSTPLTQASVAKGRCKQQINRPRSAKCSGHPAYPPCIAAQCQSLLCATPAPCSGIRVHGTSDKSVLSTSFCQILLSPVCIGQFYTGVTVLSHPVCLATSRR